MYENTFPSSGEVVHVHVPVQATHATGSPTRILGVKPGGDANQAHYSCALSLRSTYPRSPDCGEREGQMFHSHGVAVLQCVGLWYRASSVLTTVFSHEKWIIYPVSGLKTLCFSAVCAPFVSYLWPISEMWTNLRVQSHFVFLRFEIRVLWPT